MCISRREFLEVCRKSAVALGSTELVQLEEILADPTPPSVVWVQGSACTQCSVPFFTRISASTPRTATDGLIHFIDLRSHPNLKAAVGPPAATIAESFTGNDGYILIVEGGISTAFGGDTGLAKSSANKDVAFQETVIELASRAATVVCVGNCASWGSIVATPPNPSGVKAVIHRPTVNISGCPPHPDWIIRAVVQLLAGVKIRLDRYGRPIQLQGPETRGTALGCRAAGQNGDQSNYKSSSTASCCTQKM